MAHEINNTSTKRELQQNNFITTTPHGIAFTTENRKSVIVTASALLGMIVFVVLVFVIVNRREAAASTAFGDAMETYQSAIDTPGQPKTPGVTSYASVADRAKAAEPKFRAVADKFSLTQDGKTARYFQGLCELDEGQTATAEGTLKSVAGSWDGNLASLAKFALADLYRSSGRDGQAIDLYNQLAAKPTDSVPAGQAQMQLADLYTAEGKTDQARKIYGQLKDKDAKGAAGLAAAKKLNPAATPEPQL